MLENSLYSRNETVIHSSNVRFSQSTMNRPNPRRHGPGAQPIDVAMMPDGLITSIDNRRLAYNRLNGNNGGTIRINILGDENALNANGMSARRRIDTQQQPFPQENPNGSYSIPSEYAARRVGVRRALSMNNGCVALA